MARLMTLELDSPRGRTDTANARRFVEQFGREILHVPPWGKWLSWDGSRWKDDSGVGAHQRATRYSVSLWDHLPELASRMLKKELDSVVSFIRQTNQAPKIAAFMKLAQTHPSVVCTVDELNADPMLLNCVNGTLDLSTGHLRPHNPADRITQITKVAFDPEALCPKWEETLSLIFDGNNGLVRYIQQLLGYSLSGATGEHILPIAYGNGCNGKSTVWNTIAELLGDYASLANEELLMGEKSNHPTEKAALYQKRFVAISEPERGSKLKESRVKELTGDRTITARRMHEDFWSFERTHTFWISSNHLPRISGVDEGIWRRVKLIPFLVNIRDKVAPIADFDKWLIQHEGRGILAWLVRGHLDYLANGLIEPDAVTAATSNYRADSDALGEFLTEYTVDEAVAEATAGELFKVYSESFGGKWNQATFGKAMAERYTKTKGWRSPNRGKVIYTGLRLRTAKDDESEEVLPPATSSDIGPINKPIAWEEHPKGLQVVASCNPPTGDNDEGVLF